MKIHGRMSYMQAYDPIAIIGKPYKRGMLPYGGAVDSRGRIAIAITEEQNREDVERLKSLL
jgi:hypothetical protein